MNRRGFLGAIGAASLASGIPGVAASSLAPTHVVGIGKYNVAVLTDMYPGKEVFKAVSGAIKRLRRDNPDATGTVVYQHVGRRPDIVDGPMKNPWQTYIEVN